MAVAINSGGGGGGGKKHKNVKWAFFHNASILTVRGPNGTRKFTKPEWDALEPATKRYYTITHTAPGKGGDWVTVGGHRWQSLKGQGRSPVRMVKVPKRRGRPPVPPGDPKFTNWLQTGNPNKPGRDASRTGAAGDGTRAGEDVTHRVPQADGTVPPGTGQRPPKNPDKKGGDQSKLLKGLLGMMGNPKVGQMIPRKYADALAGMQFDAQIADLNQQITRAPQQGEQDLHDIGNWYGQVQDLSDRARTRNNTNTDNQASAVQAASEGLMSVLGGGANAASGVIGAGANSDQAMIRALGGINSQYQNDMAPMIQQEMAGAKTNEQNRNEAYQQDLALQLSTMKGQRGQAKVEAIMKIIDANNNLAQTRFGNRLSSVQAASAVESLIPDLKLKAAQLHLARHPATDPSTNPGPTHVKLSSLNPIDQQNVMTNFIYKADQTTRSYPQALALLHASGYHTNYAERLLRASYPRKNG